MKLNLDIFNELNESFEKEFKTKKEVLIESNKVVTNKLQRTRKRVNESVDCEKEVAPTPVETETTSNTDKVDEVTPKEEKVNKVDENYKGIRKVKEEKINEDETIKVVDSEVEPDYIINDVTNVNPADNGDVQAPDIEGFLTLVGESLESKYGKSWGKINILMTNKINETGSFALVDITTPEILKEFEEKGIQDAAIGKNLIVENVNGVVEFKVNNLNGTTKYSKKSNDVAKSIFEWVESEFLSEAKAEKEKETEILKAKTEKETVEDYINNRIDLRMEIENIKMFIDLGKQVGASEEMKPTIQNRMYALAHEVPFNIEVTNKDNKYELKFNNTDEVVEMLFGKDWVKETTPDNEVVGLKESYEQFNIGEIEVVFNPNTYETLYSIPSAEVEDKKINLTKVPSVDTPYDTDTIIKQYIETRFGRIPSEVEKEMIDKGEVSDETKEDIPMEEPTDDVSKMETTTDRVEVDNSKMETPIDNGELHEDELPDEPTGEELANDTVEEPVDEENQTETGTASFFKVRPKQSINLDEIKNDIKELETPESEYIVVDTIDLLPEEWENLTSDLSQTQTYLNDVKSLDRRNYSFNVVKLTNANANYDLLVDPLGYSYPRYIAIVDKNINNEVEDTMEETNNE